MMEIRVTQRMTEDGEAQGLRIIAENVFDLATIRKRMRQGHPHRLQRQRVRRSPGGDPAAVPPRQRRRSPSAMRTSASAASSSFPKRGASTLTTR